MKKCLILLLAAALLVPAAVAAAPARRERPGRAGSTSLERRGRTLPALVRPRVVDDLSRALRGGRLSPAQYALERARSLFDLSSVRSRYGSVARPDPRSATLLLRDLAVRQLDLEDGERAAARSLLARPTARRSAQSYRPGSTERRCSAGVCIHYATLGEDAPPPGQVDQALAVLTEVYETEVTLFGYKAPKSDATSPGNVTPEVDVYLENLGDDGLYGYCTTDDPNLQSPTYPYGAMSAYCVLDNDYAEYPNPGLPSLQVTAAHEFFHAIQFAYDIYEDPWLMEGTASWMEDEVYDDINDSYQYLLESHMTYPAVPLDAFGDAQRGEPIFQYGTWLFFRYITEIVDSRDFVRDVWERLDASAVDPFARYSLQAIDESLQARGRSFRSAYAGFAAANYLADAVYEEGAAYVDAAGGYPPEFVKRLSASRPKFNGYADLDHLTSVYTAFRPGKGLPRRAKLRVTVDTPPAIEGGEASVITLFKDGTFRLAPLVLNEQGDAVVKAPFKRRTVFQVAVILSNGSIRMDGCFQQLTRFSCYGGTPVDDGKRYFVKVRVVR